MHLPRTDVLHSLSLAQRLPLNSSPCLLLPISQRSQWCWDNCHLQKAYTIKQHRNHKRKLPSVWDSIHCANVTFSSPSNRAYTVLSVLWPSLPKLLPSHLVFSLLSFTCGYQLIGPRGLLYLVLLSGAAFSVDFTLTALYSWRHVLLLTLETPHSSAFLPLPTLTPPLYFFCCSGSHLWFLSFSQG